MSFQTVKAKLILGFGVILLLSTVAGVLSLTNMSNMNERAKHIVHESVAKVGQAQTAKQYLSLILEAEKKILLVNKDETKAILAKQLSTDVAALDTLLLDMQGLSVAAEPEHHSEANQEQALEAKVEEAATAEPEIAVNDLAVSEEMAQLQSLAAVWQEYKQLNQQIVAFSLLNSNVKAQALSRDGSRRAYDALQVLLGDAIRLAEEQREMSSGGLGNAQDNLKLALGLQAVFSDLSVKYRDKLSSPKAYKLKSLQSELKRVNRKVDNLKQSENNMTMFVNNIGKVWDKLYKQVQEAEDAKAFLSANLSVFDKLNKMSRQLANSNAGSVSSGNNAQKQSDERLLVLNRIRRNVMEALLNERALVASEAVFEMEYAVDNVELIELDVYDDLDLLKTMISFDTVAAMSEAFDAYLETFSQVAEINMENGNVNAFNLVQLKGEALAQKAVTIVDQLIVIESAAMQAEVQESESAYSSGRMLVILLILGSLVIGVGLAVSLVRSLNSGLSRLVGTAKQVQATGNFTLRTELQREDELGQVAQAFDSLLAELQTAIDQANRVLAAVADGDFDERIEVDFKGDLATLKNGVNSSAESVSYTMQALHQVMTALSAFDFSARMSDQVSGELRQQVDASMAAMQAAVAEIQQVMQQVSEGDFESRIESDLAGEMGELKGSINVSLDQLQEAITETSTIMGYQAEGDLAARMEGDYQGTLADLKTSLNHSSSNLSDTLASVSTTSNSVANMADNMAQASDDISERIQAQASSLEETAASMEELTSTVVENADHAMQAQKLTAEAVDTSKATNSIVNQAVDAMGQISESSQQMAEIIELIDSIAFQTNLLALNASVEAARAGEQGRGFAVVAAEVRTLAQKTADASKDIKELIEVNQERIERGSSFVGQSGEAMEEINRSMAEVAEFVESIARASSEQRSSIQQVSEAVNSMDNLTQQNAASVDQAADTSKLLNQEAQQLQQQVGQFKL